MRKLVLEAGTGLVSMEAPRYGSSRTPDLSQLASWTSREDLEAQVSGHNGKQEPRLCRHDPEAEQTPL